MSNASGVLDVLPAEWTVTALLKVVGLIIGTISTVWLLTQKTTYDDDQGRKRLTGAGRVAIALAAGSFLVSGLSAGFDAVLAEAKDQKRRDAEQLALRKQEQEINERRIRDAEMKAGQAQTAAALTEQKFLLLTKAAADQRRDRLLSEDLNRTSRDNVRNAARILSQVQRAANPLGNIFAEVKMRVPLTAADRGVIADLKRYRSVCFAECYYDIVDITRKIIQDNRLGALRDLWNWLDMNAAVVNPRLGRDDPKSIPLDKTTVSGDLYFPLDLNVLTAIFENGEPTKLTIHFSFDAVKTSPSVWSRTERMASTNDLVNAAAAVAFREEGPRPEFDWLRNHVTDFSLSIESAGRRFGGGTNNSFVDKYGARRFVVGLKELGPEPHYLSVRPNP